MPGVVNNTAQKQGPEPNKLILCFDGTGNTFSGSNADTNVVKVLNKLARNDPNQYHYYQTGIGTYDINEKSVYKTWYGELRSSISQTIDQGFGTTFDAHVMAGYRFLMRYYESGDKIYMFGFSRGSFTAKFLARMIYTVGLLCKGNEEMVPFAYRLYQKYLEGEIEDDQDEPPPEDGERHDHHGHNFRRARDEIEVFSNTFCRKEPVEHCGKVKEENIKVYFLGMWDCVSSVAVLEREAPKPVPVRGTAHFVRHAVAVDERRVKFKAALLAQDIRGSQHDHDHEDIKEVWFPGCHGDVGGGWPAADDDPLDQKKDMTFWQRVRNFWTTRKPKAASTDVRNDPFQMSDIPLAWMIREVELVGEKDPSAAIKWGRGLHGFRRNFNKQQALKGFMHDSLSFGYGTAFPKVLLWKFLEFFPLIKRWELVGTDKSASWKNIRFPLNKGAARDIPHDAVLHNSVVWRLKNDPTYEPKNNHGEDQPPCLKRKGAVASFGVYDKSDNDHTTYKLRGWADD